MAGRKLFTLIGAAIFLLLAGLNLYRLLVGFPITIGGYSVGATMSFFLMAAFAAISMMLFRESRQ
jgi:uncharacterized membrane protein YdjX (TVP38/TMEM64 family)